MATTAVTTEVGSSSAPAPSSAQPSIPSFSSPSAPAADSSSSSPAAETTTSSAGQSTEISPQDFGSLEDYAQALIERKQSTASRDRSAVQSSQDQEGAQPDALTVLDDDRDTQPGVDNEDSPPGAAVPHELDLEGEEFLSTKGLNDKINANAALKQALEADQPLRNAMFRNARLASEAADYKAIFPDLDSARYAADQASNFAGLDYAFMNAGSKQGAEQFMGRWAEMAMVTDENGNVVRDPSGNPRMHGAWSSVNQHIFDSQMNFVRQKAERNGDHELVAALDVIRESVSPSFPATDELPPHLRAAADSINRREQELTRQQLMQQEKAAQAFEDSLGEEASERISALVQPALEKAALSDFVRQTAREKIEHAIEEGLNNNRFFQARMAELSRFPANEEARQQRLNLIMTHCAGDCRAHCPTGSARSLSACNPGAGGPQGENRKPNRAHAL